MKAIEIGQKYLEKEARRLGVQLSKVTKADLERVAGEYGLQQDRRPARGARLRQVLRAPGAAEDRSRRGQGRDAASRKPAPAPDAVRRRTPRPARRRADGDGVIKVRGLDDLMVYRAKCCNPIRGEAIVGYVTRGKGVAVHSKMCPNVQSLMYDVERKIEVEWARAAEDSFPVRIVIHTDDRPGMLNQLTSVLSAENTNIRSLEAKGATDHDGGVVEMTVDVRDKKQLEKLVAAMRRISGVRDVERLFN